MTVEDVYRWLEEVKDPEIPVLSLVDLGVITSVVVDGEKIDVEMTPTFVGCPALDIMKEDIVRVLGEHNARNVNVKVSFRDPWSSSKLSEKGRAALKQFGLAPPPTSQIISDIDVLEHAACPQCNSTNTEIRNLFGPTLCRSIHYCFDCKEAFEQFKPL
ncbi:MAG TPA: 1,2-phenylacetyl-CoA epoxidase subunit PaaD [Chryseolinea sp.]|nr:1,2-phenylacetyl-CoA epoxidase subunit PaaD [Chryseolinea sp.]